MWMPAKTLRSSIQGVRQRVEAQRDRPPARGAVRRRPGRRGAAPGRTARGPAARRAPARPAAHRRSGRRAARSVVRTRRPTGRPRWGCGSGRAVAEREPAIRRRAGDPSRAPRPMIARGSRRCRSSTSIRSPQPAAGHATSVRIVSPIHWRRIDERGGVQIGRRQRSGRAGRPSARVATRAAPARAARAAAPAWSRRRRARRRRSARWTASATPLTGSKVTSPSARRA